MYAIPALAVAYSVYDAVIPDPASRLEDAQLIAILAGIILGFAPALAGAVICTAVGKALEHVLTRASGYR